MEVLLPSQNSRPHKRVRTQRELGSCFFILSYTNAFTDSFLFVLLSLTFSAWIFGVFATVEIEDFMAPQQKWWNEAGADTQLLHYSCLLGKHFVMVLDADGVKKVLTSPSHNDNPLYPKGFAYLRRILGHGLVTLEGPSWHRHRRIIQPAFGNINKALDDCVPDLVGSLIKCWKANPNIEIDVDSHMCAITLDLVGKLAFSHEFHAMQSIEQWARNPTCNIEITDPLIKGVHASFTPSMTRLILCKLVAQSLLVAKLYTHAYSCSNIDS